MVKGVAAKPGDQVQITSEGHKEEGILMPSFDDSVILIKLDTGYNIGFEKKKAKVKVLEKAKEKKAKKSKVAKRKDLPTIAVLHTGGTIASKVDYRTGGVSTLFSPEELLNLFPELKDIANVESELIAQMWSDDLRFKHFAVVAKKIEEYVKKGVSGIIIGSGTDNLAVFSAALSVIIEKCPVPILVLGAQRSSDRGSSDAAMNLICAAEFIVKAKDFGGVGICMHHSGEDDSCAILPANKTYKIHTSRRDAFKSINADPIAFVDYKTRRVKFTGAWYPKKSAEKGSKGLVIKPKMEEKVGLLKIHINMFPEQFEFFLDKGFKGLIVEGTGLGHTPGHVPNDLAKIHKKILPAIKKLVDSGCVVVMTSQCIFGSVNLNVYDKGRDLLNCGVLSGEDMIANTALVKLAWLLGNYKVEEVKRLVGENLRGEINTAIEYKEKFV